MSIFSRKALRTKAMQHLFAFLMQTKATKYTTPPAEKDSPVQKDDLTKLEDGLREEVIRIKHILFNLIHLLITWTRIHHKRVAESTNPSTKTLQQNVLLQRLQQHSYKTLLKPFYIWPEDLRTTWYEECLHNHPLLLTYTAQKEHTLEEDKAFVMTLIKKIIGKDKHIQKYLAWEDIAWIDNKLIVERLLIALIQNLASHEPMATYAHNLNLTVDEQAFYKDLVTHTIAQADIYERHIAQTLKNWEIARITFLDGLLLKMALTEASCTKPLPKGVIINEYLNLAKRYSTPKSHSFINGILETLIDATTSTQK